MRKAVLQFWISLDGHSLDEDTELAQVMERIDDPEQEEYRLNGLRQAGTHVIGRVTYQGMAKTRPTSDHLFAGPMNDIRRWCCPRPC